MPAGRPILRDGREIARLKTAMLARFIIIGVFNTLFTLSLIFIAKGVFNIGDTLANGLGYAVGLMLGFSLNRRWTFQHRGPILRSLPAFLCVQAIAYLLNLACVVALINYGINDYLAQALGVPPYTLASFLGSRYFVFADRKSLEG